MHSLLRISRAVLSLVLVWSAAWMLIHLPRILFRVSSYPSSQQPMAVLRGLWYGAEWAAVSAFGFALCLLLAERGRQLQHLRAWRVVAWGILGTLLLPAIQLIVAPPGYPLSDPTPALLWTTAWWSALQGGGTALVMLWLARAQERRGGRELAAREGRPGSPNEALQLTRPPQHHGYPGSAPAPASAPARALGTEPRS